MNATGLLWFSILAAIAIFFIVRQIGLAGEPDVEAALRDRALVLDVRTAGEYAQQSIPGVRNVPLDRLASEIGGLCPDRSKPILLHCLSGARSASGVSSLKTMGYSRVYNLGSFARAEKLLREANGER